MVVLVEEVDFRARGPHTGVQSHELQQSTSAALLDANDERVG